MFIFSHSPNCVQIPPFPTHLNLCLFIYTLRKNMCFPNLCLVFHWGTVHLLGATRGENWLFLSQQLTIAIGSMAQDGIVPSFPLHTGVSSGLDLHRLLCILSQLWLFSVQLSCFVLPGLSALSSLSSPVNDQSLNFFSILFSLHVEGDQSYCLLV